MAKGLGINYRLWVDAATPGTFGEVLGNTTLTINRQGNLIDTSAKSDAPYGTSAPGLRSASIDAEFIPSLPDANGFTRLETVANAAVQVPVMFAIRKAGSAGTSGDNVWLASMYVTNWTTSMGKDDALKVTCTLVLAAAPTTDVLAV